MATTVAVSTVFQERRAGMVVGRVVVTVEKSGTWPVTTFEIDRDLLLKTRGQERYGPHLMCAWPSDDHSPDAPLDGDNRWN